MCASGILTDEARDIVSTIGRGDLSTKPRPGPIVQADAFTAHHPAITVCPITSNIDGDSFYRVPVSATDGTHLLVDSEIEIDLLQGASGAIVSVALSARLSTIPFPGRSHAATMASSLNDV